MRFGERLLTAQHPPWGPFYIDYLRLKRLLNPLFGLEESPAPPHGNPIPCAVPHAQSEDSDLSSLLHYDAVSTAEHRLAPPMLHGGGGVAAEEGGGVASSESFQRELNHEVQKAMLFLMKAMGELASDLSSLSDQRGFFAATVRSLLDEDEGMGAKRGDGAKGGSSNNDARRQQLAAAMLQQLRGIDDLRNEYLVRVGSKLLLLLEFVELNVEAIVKIVKKHDKFLSRWEESGARRHSSVVSEDKPRYARLRRQYLPRFAVYSPDPNVRCLFLAAADAGDGGGGAFGGKPSTTGKGSDGNYGGWDVIQWNLEVALRELFRWEKDLRWSLSDGGGGDNLGEKEAPTPKAQSFKQLASRSFSDTVTPSPVESGGIAGGGGTMRRLIARSSTLLESFNAEAKADADSVFFEPIIYQIQSSRRRMGQMHHRYIRMLYAHEMLHLVDDGENIKREDERILAKSLSSPDRLRKISMGSDDEAKRKWTTEPGGGVRPKVSRLSKFLNLASAGLYMCNYNIVAPTAGVYAKLLGNDPANAGVIIGMTPTAVIVSSVLYSWWSSYSYKRALLFASSCCAVGNIVYALALPCNSLQMVLLGRLLTGFGSARVINRRYIADYYSIEDRTSGMANFVSASALGMALGPALAASLGIVAPTDLSDSNSFWTIETAPGYVMFILWLIYMICNVFFFEEPDREDRSAPNPPARQRGGGYRGSDEARSLLRDQDDAATFPDAANSARRTADPLLKCCGNVPVLISLLLLALLKSVIEGISSSAPTVSRFYFGWGVHASGMYLAMLASFVLPTNHIVAYVSRRFDDRELILGTLVVMLAGLLGFLVYSDDGEKYSETQFVLFGLVIFVACNALEGPTMGLLSKTIPKSLARGILNAGLLATEAGTLGRVIGDFWLSTAAFRGLNQMVNRTFEPMCAMVGVSIVATIWSYPHLQPRFEDEDDD